MSELLFENYNVPAVAYGIDGLFSAYHSSMRRGVPLWDALVVSSGHQATHIMPVLDEKFDARHCKRSAQTCCPIALLPQPHSDSSRNLVYRLSFVELIAIIGVAFPV